MKALLTAGGRATRLRPITHTLNKHLIPLANKPMIVYALEKISEAGITEVGINVNPGERELPQVLGDGSRWGMRITYLEQTGGPKGLGHILKNAREWIGNEPFLFYLGDNIVLSPLKRFIDTFESQNLDCLLTLASVEDPQRFGVAELRDGRVVRVLEKPEVPPSDFAVSGIYLYSPSVFLAAEGIQPSARGEYEISDVHTWLIERGYRVGHEEITGWWKDTGKPDDLLQGNTLILERMEARRFADDAFIGDGVVLEGIVNIGSGSRIEGNTVLKGPLIIGNDCRICDSTVGPYVSLSDRVTIECTSLTQSIVMENSHIQSPEPISDSIFGRNVSVSAASSERPSGSSRRYLLGDNAVAEL